VAAKKHLPHHGACLRQKLRSYSLAPVFVFYIKIVDAFSFYANPPQNCVGYFLQASDHDNASVQDFPQNSAVPTVKPISLNASEDPGPAFSKAAKP
tara:strand:- start:132 stop:419 length:288 start_codon:yes stop_codon:yes gene_type:complete